MNLSWYPAHIAKARRKIRQRLKKIDVLIEVLDCRAPFSTNLKLFDFKDKLHIFLYNKKDLINEENLKKIKTAVKTENSFFISAKSVNDFSFLIKHIEKNAGNLSDKLKNYGFKNKSVSVMIVGMPNVGKTNIIKKISKNKKLSVANRPGVTRAEQWITYGNIKILDTPGILFPEIDDEEIIYKLAILNIINPHTVGYDIVLEYFWNFLNADEKKSILKHYEIEGENYEKFLENFSEKYGVRNEIDIASKIFNDYNKGKFKHILLDRIDEI